MKFTLLIVGIIIITTGFIFRNDIQSIVSSEQVAKEYSKEKKKKKGKKEKATPSTEVKILEKWDLPSELKEISGIAYMDDQRFACIQDEEGKIFIFNRTSGKIEREIPFAGTGDYEDLVLDGNTVYIIRADGKLFQVDIKNETKEVKQYNTALTAEQNVEGLCYDKNSNRLLLAIKNDEPGSPGYKGIYAFDLSKMQFIKEPVFKIDLSNEILNSIEGKKNNSVMPSAIAIHPVSNEIFITDGPKAKLIIMDNSGNIKKTSQLGKEFAQPEGLAFSPQGELFISNEGTKQPGNILKVEIQ